MNVLALVQESNHVCSRYRIEAFAWALAQRGLTLQVAPLARSTFRRARQFLDARRADVVILQRKLLPLWQLHLLRRTARRLIYDVDDALFQRDSYSPKPAKSFTRLARFWATVYTADAVIAGNDYLKERTAAYVGSRRVHVIPTCVEPGRYPIADHRRGPSAVRLVWIGQKSTARSLQQAGGHLAAAADRLPGLQLRVISDWLPRLAGVRTVLQPWSSATETAGLAAADIGVCWLPDDLWSRGKCGLKVIQYMAAGLPVVANPVGMNCRLVQHGRTGLLASTPAEWAAAIGRLAADPSLRRAMGHTGRRVVQEQYSVARWGPEFARLVESVARRRGVGANMPTLRDGMPRELTYKACSAQP